MHVSLVAPSKVHAVVIASMLFASFWFGLALTLDGTNAHLGLEKNDGIRFGRPRSSSIPTCNQPVNQSVLLYQAGVVISWTIRNADRTSGLYLVFHDAVPTLTISLLANVKTWYNNTPLSVPVNTTIAGWHNYTIFFTDMTISEMANATFTGNYSTAWVHIETPPTIHAPAELRIHCGAIGRSLDITITDPDSASGRINVTRNGSMVIGPDLQWNESQVISIPITTTTPALFDFGITVTDRNYTVQQQSIAWVAYSFPPEILGLRNRTVSPDARIATITFRITDVENATGNCTVLRGGIPFNNSYVNATWTNNSQRVVYAELTIIGLNNYQIIAEDLTNNKTTKTFSIYVNDPPKIKSSSPQNYTKPNDNITWVISDSDNVTGTYSILRNGTTLPAYVNLPWMNGSTIEMPVSTGVIGSWSYTIVFTDGLSTRHHTIIISITGKNSVPLEPMTVTIILWVFVIVGLAGMGIILGSKKK